jgi:hypothetical protein
MHPNLNRRLDALEQVAEECRRREEREALRGEIIRQYAAAGMALSADQVEAKAARAVVLAEHLALLLANGLTLDDAARCIAVEHDLNPDRVVAIFSELRAARPGTETVR